MKKSFPSSTIWLLWNLEGQDQLLILATYQWILFCFENIIMNIFYFWHILILCSHYLFISFYAQIFPFLKSSWLCSRVLDLWFDSFFAFWHNMSQTYLVPYLYQTWNQPFYPDVQVFFTASDIYKYQFGQ